MLKRQTISKTYAAQISVDIVSTNLTSQQIEKQFAVKVVQHMETYWKILERKRGSALRLTRYDDQIFTHFKMAFPDFDPASRLDENEMKSKKGKEQWRQFINEYEKGDHKIDDYNYGAMVRASPKEEYTQEGTVFVVRMQFYAIEIAR